MQRYTRTAIGLGLLAAGVAMVVLPGPGVVTIGAGLALLAREHSWARTALVRFRSATERLLGRPASSDPPGARAVGPDAA